MNTRGRGGWQRFLARLAADGALEVLVEGGAALAASALRAGMVRRISLFYSPRFMGGDGVPMLAGLGVRRPAQAPALRTLRFGRVSPVDEDLLWEGEPQ